MAGQIPAVPGEGAYASAKLSRVAGTNVQVDDPFHGRSDTGGPRGRGLMPHPIGYRRSQGGRGLRLSEALGPPLSRVAGYKFSG